jgi:hypothetical protein
MLTITTLQPEGSTSATVLYIYPQLFQEMLHICLSVITIFLGIPQLVTEMLLRNCISALLRSIAEVWTKKVIAQIIAPRLEI